MNRVYAVNDFIDFRCQISRAVIRNDDFICNIAAVLQNRFDTEIRIFKLVIYRNNNGNDRLVLRRNVQYFIIGCCFLCSQIHFIQYQLCRLNIVSDQAIIKASADTFCSLASQGHKEFMNTCRRALSNETNRMFHKLYDDFSKHSSLAPARDKHITNFPYIAHISPGTRVLDAL